VRERGKEVEANFNFPQTPLSHHSGRICTATPRPPGSHIAAHTPAGVRARWQRLGATDGRFNVSLLPSVDGPAPTSPVINPRKTRVCAHASAPPPPVVGCSSREPGRPALCWRLSRALRPHAVIDARVPVAR
jgi:hypothetical protein